MSTVHIPAVSTNNIEDGTASKTDIADDINKNIQRQTQKPEKLFDVIGLSILGRVAFKNIINTQTSVKKSEMDIQHWTGPVPQTWALEGACSSPPGLGRAATKAAKVATAKMAILENMVKMNEVK